MPANGRWDLIRRLKVKSHNTVIFRVPLGETEISKRSEGSIELP